MQRTDFSIGGEFYTEAGKWRCTDVGTRVVVAIKLDAPDESWYNGPPYAVAETVFDEYDFEGAAQIPTNGTPRECNLTSVAAVKGRAVRYVTAQRSALLRSQLFYLSLCSRTRR